MRRAMSEYYHLVGVFYKTKLILKCFNCSLEQISSKKQNLNSLKTGILQEGDFYLVLQKTTTH
jgi:hypothetical protein